MERFGVRVLLTLSVRSEIIMSILYKIELSCWKLKEFFREKRIRFRFRKIDNYKPFYDKRDKVYRVFFIDRPYEEGSVNYVVSEYIQDGLYYPYNIYFKHSHSHTFDDVLDAIRECNGEGFRIDKEDIKYYSKQELNMIAKYVKKLQEE